MIGQSFAIIAVILVMAFMFLRSGRRAAALFALPLISVSLFHLLGFALQRLFDEGPVPAAWLHIAADVFGFAVGTLLCLKLARAITVKKLRLVYFISCVVFLGALAAAYISTHI